MKVVCISSHARSSVLITHLKTATLIDLAVVVDAMQGFGNIVDMIWKVLQVPKHTDLFFFGWQPQHYNIRECFQFGLTLCRVYEARLAIAIYLCEHREDVHVGGVRYCMGVCVRCHHLMSMCMCLSCV